MTETVRRDKIDRNDCDSKFHDFSHQDPVKQVISRIRKNTSSTIEFETDPKGSLLTPKGGTEEQFVDEQLMSPEIDT